MPPNLASAVNIGAFNLGNAIGATLGGGVIAADFGLPAVALARAAMAALGWAAVWFVGPADVQPCAACEGLRKPHCLTGSGRVF